MKALIEETFLANEATPVILVTHSMGGTMMLYFLNHQSAGWKARYVRALVTLAGPWGGSVRALKVFAVGDNLGNWLLSEKKLMWEQRSSSSLAWLMPQREFWGTEEVLHLHLLLLLLLLLLVQLHLDLPLPRCWCKRPTRTTRLAITVGSSRTWRSRAPGP